MFVSGGDPANRRFVGLPEAYALDRRFVPLNFIEAALDLPKDGSIVKVSAGSKSSITARAPGSTSSTS